MNNIVKTVKGDRLDQYVQTGMTVAVGELREIFSDPDLPDATNGVMTHQVWGAYATSSMLVIVR